MSNIVIQKMIEYFGTDIRRINHALKVYGFSTCIADSEGLTENELLIIHIASILHVIGIKEAEKKIQFQHWTLSGNRRTSSCLRASC
jgi:hypothetical protein